MAEYKSKHEEKGIVQVVMSVIVLVVGMVIVTVTQIFGGVLSGQTYQLTEDKITAITNTTIKQSVQQSILAGFEAQETTASYTPIIGLGIIVTLVLSMIVGLMFLPGLGGGMGRGSAL